MRQDVKDLADAMERGWKLAPKNCYWFFNDDCHTFDIPVSKVISACAMGHALLGIGSTNTQDLNKFPVLYTQNVALPNSSPAARAIQNLEWTLNDMLQEKWTTPQVIAWLRTHQND